LTHYCLYKHRLTKHLISFVGNEISKSNSNIKELLDSSTCAGVDSQTIQLLSSFTTTVISASDEVASVTAEGSARLRLVDVLLQRYAITSKNVILLVFYVVIVIVTVIAAAAMGLQNKLMLQLDIAVIFLVVLVLTILATFLMVSMVRSDVSCLRLCCCIIAFIFFVFITCTLLDEFMCFT
jgi:hypothetical protein